jgi:cell division protein FtsL
MSKFHVVSRRIDNSRLKRPHSSGHWREMLKQLAVGGLLAGVIFLYAWQHFQSVQFGYQVESLKEQQRQMIDLNHQLKLETASLRSPERIDQIAHKLGLTAPAADQLQPFEAPSEPVFAEMRPADSVRAR